MSEFVTLTTAAPQLSVRALLDSATPTVKGGVGGWQVVARPRRVSLTSWEGRTPFGMTVSVVLDGYKERRTVDIECSRIERMGLPHPNPGGEPPIVKLTGVPHSDLSWVIQDIAWGEAIRRRDGARLRQFAVIELLQYVADDRLILMPAAERRRREAAKKAQNEASKRGGGSSPRNKLYIVKSGDTLSSIAARKLGNAKRWPELAKLNNIRDPNKIKVGQEIRLP